MSAIDAEAMACARASIAGMTPGGTPPHVAETAVQSYLAALERRGGHKAEREAAIERLQRDATTLIGYRQTREQSAEVVDAVLDAAGWEARGAQRQPPRDLVQRLYDERNRNCEIAVGLAERIHHERDDYGAYVRAMDELVGDEDSEADAWLAARGAVTQPGRDAAITVALGAVLDAARAVTQPDAEREPASTVLGRACREWEVKHEECIPASREFIEFVAKFLDGLAGAVTQDTTGPSAAVREAAEHHADYLEDAAKYLSDPAKTTRYRGEAVYIRSALAAVSSSGEDEPGVFLALGNYLRDQIELAEGVGDPCSSSRVGAYQAALDKLADLVSGEADSKGGDGDA